MGKAVTEGIIMRINHQRKGNCKIKNEINNQTVSVINEQQPRVSARTTINNVCAYVVGSVAWQVNARVCGVCRWTVWYNGNPNGQSIKGGKGIRIQSTTNKSIR